MDLWEHTIVRQAEEMVKGITYGGVLLGAPLLQINSFSIKHLKETYFFNTGLCLPVNGFQVIPRFGFVA